MRTDGHTRMGVYAVGTGARWALTQEVGMRIAILAAVLLFSGPGISEPWLSNRFAQDCVGCHDEGRPNLDILDRRCTLSCQGCHVSPNGGGMRSVQFG